MGKVVTIMNMKGGVGKTTLAVHLAGIIALYAFKEKRRKVLLIDYDPQFNASQAFIPVSQYFELEAQRKTILAVLIEDDRDIDPYRLQVPGSAEPPKLADVVRTVYKPSEGRGSLDIVPSTLDLMYVVVGQTEKRTTPIEERFHKFITECRKTYDFVFIDCHPAGSVLTKTSLGNSDHVIIPVAPQTYAIRGVGLMMRFIESARLGHVGPTPHIVFNLTPRRGGTTHEEEEIRKDPRFKDMCLSHNLHYYKVFADPSEGQGFVWHTRKPWSFEAFNNLYRLADEFVKRSDTEVAS